MSEVCHICGAAEASAASLVQHLKTAHKDDNPAQDLEMNPEAHIPGLVCGLCGRRFATAQALAQHNLEPHSSPPGTKVADPGQDPPT